MVKNNWSNIVFKQKFPCKFWKFLCFAKKNVSARKYKTKFNSESLVNRSFCENIQTETCIISKRVTSEAMLCTLHILLQSILDFILYPVDKQCAWKLTNKAFVRSYTKFFVRNFNKFCKKVYFWSRVNFNTLIITSFSLQRYLWCICFCWTWLSNFSLSSNRVEESLFSSVSSSSYVCLKFSAAHSSYGETDLRSWCSRRIEQSSRLLIGVKNFLF